MTRSIYPVASLAAALVLSGAAFAQTARIQFKLDHLADKATETVTVTLDKSLIELARRILPKGDPNLEKVKSLLDSLEGIYVKSFEFDKSGQYSLSDVENIRKQMKAPGWNCIVEVRSRAEKGGDNVDVCLRQDGEKILGLAVLAAEANELTVVNIVGNIRPEDLADLQGTFRIPHIEAIGKELEKNKKIPRVTVTPKDKEKQKENEE